MNTILFSLIISHFVIGFTITTIIMLSELRGKEYDPYYFDIDMKILYVIGIFLGWLWIFDFSYEFLKKYKKLPKHIISKLFWKLANVGMKKR